MLDSKLRVLVLGELPLPVNYGASARCGSLLRARVGRQHSRLRLQRKHFVAKNGNGGPADTMQPHALQCTTATVREDLSDSGKESAERDAAQKTRTAVVTLDAGDGLLGRSGNEHRWKMDLLEGRNQP